MPSEPVWLSADEITVLNLETVHRTGEPHLTLDRGLLESACGVPLNLWAYGGEEDVVALATGLMTALARNHPFQQGNKRTAFVAGAAFLERNGYRLLVEDSASVADVFVDVIKGEMTEEAFSTLLNVRVSPLQPD